MHNKKNNSFRGKKSPAHGKQSQKPLPAKPVSAPVMDPVRFEAFELPPEIMRAIQDLGFEICMPIQSAILQPLLDGRDAAGQAQTGTGKTLAFLVGIFTKLLRSGQRDGHATASPRALVVAPTRELAIQIEKDARDIGKYLPFRTIAVYGGLDYKKQAHLLKNNCVDLVVATPGRLLDYFGRGVISLNKVEVLVLDEADRMMDMGFMPDVRRIVRATPPRERRQTMLFSATLDKTIMARSAAWMTDPVHVEITPERRAAESVEQKVFIVTSDMKFNLLYHILKEDRPLRTIIYANRRTTVERLHQNLTVMGFSCCKLSGAISQDKRLRTLEAFRKGEIPLMVATDVAGRGLHVEGVSHIINYNVPVEAEDYVHRIGRTGRAGAVGISITFACEEESFYLPAIEDYLGHELTYSHPEDDWLTAPPGVERLGDKRRRKGGSPRGSAQSRRAGDKRSRGPRRR